MNALSLLALAVLTAPAAAQCAIIPGTGCPGVPPLKTCVNHPSIGSVFCMNSVPCPACSPVLPLQFNAWFVGPPSPFFVPGCCTPLGCGIYSPLLFQVTLRPGPVECYTIPNNPALIGEIITFQPVCLELLFGCYDVAPALQVTIRA